MCLPLPSRRTLPPGLSVTIAVALAGTVAASGNTGATIGAGRTARRVSARLALHGVFHGVFKRTEILACQSGAVPTMATATAIAVNAVVFRLKPALAASEALFCHGKMGPPFSQGVARKKRARASLASHHQAHQRHERSADAIATAPQLIAKVVDQSRTQARASGIGIPGMGPL